jgi:hypothetical protein
MRLEVRINRYSDRLWWHGGLLLVASLWILLAGGCRSGPKDVPLDQIPLTLEVVRLDEALYDCSVALRKDSALPPQTVFDRYFREARGFITDWMFGGNDSLATDSMIGQAMKEFAADPQGQMLLDTLHATLGGLDLGALLENPLKRYKYFFPAKPTPMVVAFADGYPRTAQAGLDQVSILPRHLGIGMHYFMGESFLYYPTDLPYYIRRRCTPEHLPSLVVHQIAEAIVPEPDFRGHPVLVDHVIRAGIVMVVVDKLLGPAVSDTLKLFYDASQMDWVHLYEGRIYKDLVTDLYSADPTLQRRYLHDSPFTSQLHRGSAPRLGQFMGWKIVSAYLAEHPDMPVDALLQATDYQRIFKDSGYRPPQEH